MDFKKSKIKLSLNSDLASNFTEKNFYFGPGSDVGSFILGLTVGVFNELNQFTPVFEKSIYTPNDDSLVVQLLTVSKYPKLTKKTKNEGKIQKNSGLGCSANASEQNLKQDKLIDSSYFMLEMYGYFLILSFFVALRKCHNFHK